MSSSQRSSPLRSGGARRRSSDAPSSEASHDDAGSSPTRASTRTAAANAAAMMSAASSSPGRRGGNRTPGSAAGRREPTLPDTSSPLPYPSSSSPLRQPAARGNRSSRSRSPTSDRRTDADLFGSQSSQEPHSAVSTPRTPRTPGTPATPRSGPSVAGCSPRGLRRHVRSGQSGDSDIRIPATDTELPDSEADLSSGRGAQLGQTIIWGTSIVVNETYKTFHEFVTTCFDPVTNELVFDNLLERIKETETWYLNLDCELLRRSPGTVTLYQHLLLYPQEIIPIMDMVINDVFEEKFPDVAVAPQGIQVRPYNLEKTTNMRDLNPSDIDGYVAIKGLVIRVSNVIPDLKLAYFECLKCNASVTVPVDRGRVEEPTRCANCSSMRSMNHVYNRCTYADKQVIRLQETPDTIPDGQTPHTVTLLAYDDLVDVPRAGDRVEVTGIYRATPVRVNPRNRAVHQLYRTYIDVVHIRMTDSKRVRVNRKDVGPSEYSANLEDEATTKAAQEAVEQKVLELASQRDIYERLTRSLAPSIYEMDNVKKGILCQLFGGTNKTTSEERFRGEINVLLCGDPGTSKSQMLQYVHKIAPRGIYTSGKGSTAVGLTAYITKDPDSKQFVLESGALVLSDGGICCIDEFDKMNDATRSVLHEVMEQQTVSIAKAGIICTLNARTAILASANPQNSRYDPQLSVVENLQLPPTLLSRFDLIYLILDKPDPTSDRQLASHLVGLYQAQRRQNPEGILDTQTLSEYISYAREKIHPQLSEDAARDLTEGYVELRKSSGSRQTVAATPRQLESLVRLSEAIAKMRLSNTVERRDVAEAMRLMKVALLTAATDPVTGRVDMDLISTGISTSSRSRISEISRVIRTIMSELTSNTIKLEQLEREVNRKLDRRRAFAQPATVEQLEGALTELQDHGLVTVQGDLRHRGAVVRRLATDDE